jgi:hypothetical protein
MKKYIGFMVLAGLLLSFSLTQIVSATESNEANDNRPVFNKELKEKRMGFISKMQEKREAFKDRIQTERQAFIEKMKSERDAFMTELKAKKEEWKAANSEKKEDFKNKAQKMIGERFEAAVTNLERFQTKISDLIEKLEAEGKNTEEAQSGLDMSKQKLSDAKTKIAEVKALIPTDGSKVTPEVFEKIKLLAREAKELLKESREYLHDSIEAIKELKGDDTNTSAE